MTSDTKQKGKESRVAASLEGPSMTTAGKWDDLKPELTPWILRTIQESFHFTHLTPIQASLIPLATTRQKDLLVEAVTGSGKTLSYIVPLLERLVKRESELAASKGSATEDASSMEAESSKRARGLRKNEVFAIIVVPTRELATQVHSVLKQFFDVLNQEMHQAFILDQEGEDQEVVNADNPDTGSALAHGQESPEVEAYYPPPLLLTSGQGTSQGYSSSLPPPSPVIVATPGRLARYVSAATSSSALGSSTSSWSRSRKHMSLSNFDVLVLDEADALLGSKDHLKDMMQIWRCLPRQRRNWLFSATMMDLLSERELESGIRGGLTGLEMAGLRNLTRVVVRVEAKRKRGRDESPEESRKRKSDDIEKRTPLSLRNTYLVCPQAEKTLQFLRLIQLETTQNEASKFIVYFSTCAAVDYFYRALQSHPILKSARLSSLHGHLPASARASTMEKFRSHASLPNAPSILLCTDVAARGLDLPDVDVVIQYDPPTDPKVFSHRAGRTARAGRQGKSVVLLARGSEEGYVDFMALRKIPLRKQNRLKADLNDVEGESSNVNVDPEAFKLRDTMRQAVLADRDFAERAAKAFVSAVRAYSKHEASYIFRLKNLDLFGMGVAFGLLRLPKMPEVKAWKENRSKAVARCEKSVQAGEPVKNIDIPGDGIDWEDADVDWDKYSYVDRQREAHRIQELEKSQENASALAAAREEAAADRRAKALKQSAWSNKKDRKDKREERKEKKGKKKDWQAKVSPDQPASGTGRPAKRGFVDVFLEGRQLSKEESKSDSDDLDDDYRALKRDSKQSILKEEEGMFDDL